MESTVVIIEDNRFIAEMYGEILEKEFDLRYRVVSSMDDLRNSLPLTCSLVIMDYYLGSVVDKEINNGFRIARVLRLMNPGIPIIGISSAKNLCEISKFENVDIDTCINKNNEFFLQEFMNSISVAITGKGYKFFD